MKTNAIIDLLMQFIKMLRICSNNSFLQMHIIHIHIITITVEIEDFTLHNMSKSFRQN